ncbi:MAG TPA: AAA family ATPase [Alphaproteobacteria bacterium]|nr:AAA family ATPase [Alphaproteobacteria bacterium]USO05770.1 MAG: AAA family ATPase [Rhodospirillales bacterium]HOO81444.1 AAA family ATPase [Alphaproteobacteria bacterium]
MSEVDSQATSILLPASSVAVYSKDQKTLQAARDLENDWRFARVSVQDEEGDVENAIATYQDIASPTLIIIQTDVIDKSFTARLEELAGHCEAGTSAIIVGPDNDVNLYRRLIDMGVSDYLVRPISSADLAKVVSKALIEKIGVTGSRLVAVMGAKGGVGSSIISEALACGLTDILGQKAILLDASGGWSTLAVGLGFEPSTTLSEAVRAAENADEDSLKRMLYTVSDKLSVLATGGDVMLEQGVSPDQLETLIDMLMVKYPFVIVDLSQSAAALQKIILTRANQILVTATPTLPALRLARSLIQEVKEVRGGEDSDVSLIVNMQGQAPANEVSKSDIEKAMEFSVAAYLPYDAKMFLGNESESRKLTDDKVARDLIKKTLLPVLQKSLTEITTEGAEEGGEEGGFLGNLLGKLKSKG